MPGSQRRGNWVGRRVDGVAHGGGLRPLCCRRALRCYNNSTKTQRGAEHRREASMSGQANLALDLGEQNLSTGWVTSPPIRKLKQSEIKMSAEWLHGGIGSFSSPTAPANFQNRVDLGLERAEVLGLQDNEIVYEVYAYIY